MFDDYEPSESLLDGDFSCETTEEINIFHQYFNPCEKCVYEEVCNGYHCIKAIKEL